VKRSPLAQTRRRIRWGWFTAGVVCIFLAQLPFVETAALYFLPLRYLSWFGLALTPYGFLANLYDGEMRKACRYVQEGEVAFGRVFNLVKAPTLITHGEPCQYAFFAQVLVLHPDTQEEYFYDLRSRDFEPSFLDNMDTRFRVGDAVPVVWLRGQFDSTLQIYDFLEVMPEASLLYQPSTSRLKHWCKLTALPAFLAFFFFIMFWTYYAMNRFAPLDFDFERQARTPLVVGGLLGLAGMVIVFFVKRRGGKQRAQRNVQAAAAGKAIELEVHRSVRGRILRGIFFWPLLTSAVVMMGGGVFLSWCFIANGLMDSSPPKRVPVQITDVIEWTDGYIFCDYELKFRRATDTSDQTLRTTPQHLHQFVAPRGVAIMREGWLGWPWLETIEPVIVDDELPDIGKR